MSTQSTPTNVGELDRATLAMYIGLVAIGWLMIYAVNYDAASRLSFLTLDTSAGKQLFFIVICFALLFFILMSDWTVWRTFGFVIYIATIVILIGPFFLGREVNGANAWYHLGGFSFQPSELAKFGTCLAMANYLSSVNSNLRTWRNRLISFGIFLLPVLIIVLQKDVGSALIFFSFLMVLYREGLSPSMYVFGFGIMIMVIAGLRFDPIAVVACVMAILNQRLIDKFKTNRLAWYGIWALLFPLSYWWKPVSNWFLEQSGMNPAVYPLLPFMVLVPHLILCVAAFIPNYLAKNNQIQSQLRLMVMLATLASALAYSANFACYTILEPHQQIRIKLWLRPWEVTDTRGAAYNLLHSKMAIGSGGLSGKGFLEGNMTKLDYVPEQSTDYIFCTVGEEHGFIGAASVIIIFGLLLYRLTVLAERQRSNFSRIYIYGVAGVIFMHMLINIGMTMGLFPTIGIPLPFISAGGSSLIGFTLMLGIVLKLDSHRNML